MTTTTADLALIAVDAFGAAIEACHRAGSRAGTAYAVFERDDGMLTVNDAVMYLAEDHTWPGIDQRAPLAATGRVLDLGCGAGRHTHVLRRRGIEVRGVDASPGVIAVARSLGVDADLADLNALPGELGTFDTFLLLGGNLGLLGGRDTGRRVLTSLTRLARPGARLIGTAVNPYRLTDPAHRQYGEGNIAAGRMFGQHRMRARFRNLAGDWFDLLLLSPDELGELTEGTGWTLGDVEEEGPMYVATLRLA
jgi:SAM-dependent methyltransferase